MKITVGKFIELLEKNGYQWTRNEFRDYTGASCAMGQVVRNLGFEDDLDLSTIGYNLNDRILLQFMDRSPYSIIGFNDSNAASYEDVVNYAKNSLAGLENEVIDYEIPEPVA